MTALIWKNIGECMCSAKFQSQNLLSGLQRTCRCFYTRAFWLCMVHTLNKRFFQRVVFPFVCTAKSLSHRVYLWAFSQHVVAFARDPFCCAWSKLSTIVFAGEYNFLFNGQRKVPSTESTPWPSATMLVLFHMSTLVVRDPYTEQALFWKSNVSCLHSAECQTQNLLFRLEPRCIHTLNKRFCGEVMFLVFTYR